MTEEHICWNKRIEKQMFQTLISDSPKITNINDNARSLTLFAIKRGYY